MGTLWTIEHVLFVLAAVLTFSIQTQPKCVIEGRATLRRLCVVCVRGG